MIKICHIANLITGKADGVYTHIMMLLNNLDKTKYEQILIFQGGQKIEEEMNKIGIRTYVIDCFKKKFSLKLFIELYRIIKKEKINIIQTHLLKPYAVAGVLNIVLKKKLIFNYHGLFIDNLYYNKVEKFIYKIIHFLVCKLNSVDLAIVPSNTSREILLKETKHFKKISVYYNSYSSLDNKAVTDSIITDLVNIKQNFLLVGIIARIEIQKRIDRALKVLKLLIEENSNVFFVFMGDGPLEKEMHVRAIELGEQDYCKFYGFVENAANYIGHFDMLLFTSEWEGMPLAMWEAMAKGVPIISSDVGGVKEIIELNECGIIYEKENISEAANIILDLTKQPDMRKMMGENGRAAIKEKYNLQNFTNTFDKFYRELIEN